MKRTFCYYRNGEYYTKVVIVEDYNKSELLITNSTNNLATQSITFDEEETEKIKNIIQEYVKEIDNLATLNNAKKKEILEYLEEKGFEIEEEEE